MITKTCLRDKLNVSIAVILIMQPIKIILLQYRFRNIYNMKKKYLRKRICKLPSNYFLLLHSFSNQIQHHKCGTYKTITFIE